MSRNPIPSSCSCSLPLGQWGQEGWHYYRPTYERLLDRASADSGVTDRNLLEAWYGRIARAAAGQQWAIEPCPQWRRAVSQGISKRKRDARTGEPREVI